MSRRLRGLALPWLATVLAALAVACPIPDSRCNSDEDCDARIPVKLSVYRAIHENRDAFIIKLKHQVEAIEKVIQTEDGYSVVEKNNSTAEPGKDLNETSVDNS